MSHLVYILRDIGHRKEITTDSRSSEMHEKSADDAIDAGVPNTGFTLL